MSPSRVHGRIATLVGVVPLVIASGLAAPAFAVDSVRTAALVQTQGAYKIGPNAGFGGATDKGISGRTAIVAISAAPSDTLTSVKVTVAESGPFAYANDFDAVDGFALYKDLNDNDRLDQAEFDAGMVSQAQPNVGVVNGIVTVTVAADPSKATGEDNYLLTTHPLATAAGERTVFFTVPTNGVVTSAGTSPSSALTLPDIVLDAQAPAQIPLNNFVPKNRIPTANCPTGAPADACGNDSYLVYRFDSYDPDDMIGFYNSGTDLTDAAELVLPGGAPAEYPLQTISNSIDSKTSLSIGNGTGRDASVAGSKALNNQISDDVYAVQWDPMGNLTTLRLTNAPTCQPGPNCNEPNPFVPHGNDVTAPQVSWTTVMDQVNAASTTSQIGVHGTLTSTDAAVPQFVAQTAIQMLAKPQEVKQVAGSSPAVYEPVANHSGAEKRSSNTVTPGSGSQVLNATVDVSDPDVFPEGEYIWSANRLVDVVGNSTAIKNTAAVLKDTVAPNFVRISLLDLNNDGNADEGEKFRVEFDDAMDTPDITSANVATRLVLSDPASGTCGSPVPQNCPPTWGSGATVAWSEDQRLLTITLGAPCSALSVDCTSYSRLPQEGDKVTPSGVTDRNQNPVANGANFLIGAPTTLPVEARTVDTPGIGQLVWNTNRDGVLDAIDVEFSGNLDANSVNNVESGHLFTVSWLGTNITPTVSLTSPDTIHLAFTVPSEPVDHRPEWSTGATPKVTLTGTALKTSGNETIPAFELTSVDRVAPVPLSAVTADTGTKDGHIDQVVVTFSEGIRQDAAHAPNVCGWRVAGYTDANYRPHGFPSATACNPTANRPTAGATNNVVVLSLAPSVSFDTGATPLLTFSATSALPSYGPNSSADPECAGADDITGNVTSPDCPILDTSNTTIGLESFSGTVADGAGPVILSRGTEDTNSDGRIDRIKATFSETLSTPSIGAAQFQVTEPAYTVESLSAPASNVVAVNVQNVPPRTGDTDVQPKLTFLGGTTDLADPPNASPADTGVVVSDTAGPAILGACASSPAGTNGSCPADDATKDNVTILLSEVIAPGSVAANDFVVEQPVGTVKTPTGFNVEPDNKRVTLAFAQGAIDSAAAGVVRFAGAAKVTDAETTPNGNTQVDNVPIFPAPTVTLSLSCPSAASAGYCGDNQVNTGAGGSPGVSMWRLSTTARSATPPSSEFSSTLPTVYPDSGVLPEGVLTLYLSGMDSFGRLSPEVSSSITILKAPHINNVQFVNATPANYGTWPKMGGTLGQTVLDGDSVRVGADAQGTDAADWATKTTGGGCLAQYMSIDLRGLSGSSSQSAVAPVSCDLKTNTAPPYRQMQFPFVKVAKTTKYPVGTVLRSSGSGINYLIADGPNGTQQRRRYISVNARRSWQVPDALVITVPTSLLAGIPLGANVGYRDGSIVHASGTGYYYVNGGVKRPVSSTTLAYWKIPTSTAYTLTTDEIKAMPTSTGIGQGAHPVGVWIKFANGKVQQVARNGNGTVVRRDAAASALKTLVPSTQIYPANSKDAALPLDTWVRGYRDGTVLKVSTGYAVVARGSLRRFANARTFNSLGYVTTYAITANGAAMPHVSGQAYRVGAAIDRYKITSIVVKVTNKAGAVVTAIVTPAQGGIYGVGTLDAVPSGWDFTRS